MTNNRNKYNFDKVYNQGKDTRKSQGSDDILNQIVKNALINEMDFLTNSELLLEVSEFSAAQEVPQKLKDIISVIYRIFVECHIVDEGYKDEANSGFKKLKYTQPDKNM